MKFPGVIFVSKYLVKKYGMEEAIRKTILKGSRIKYNVTLADSSVLNQEIKL